MDTILIGVCTYKRPQMLVTCLGGLAKLERPEGAVLKVVVVDNDPDTTYDPATLPYPGLIYEREPQRGIPYARNRVLDVAQQIQADYIAFIDDDEIPSPGWIVGLYDLLQEKQVDVVRGRVIYQYPEGDSVHLWRDTKERHRTGEKVITGVATNNVMFSSWIARQLRFSTSVPLGMGEDIDFFRRAVALGAQCVFHREAVTYETVPVERGTTGWHFRRALNDSISRTRLGLHFDQRTRTRAQLILKAIRRVVEGSVQTLAYPLCKRKGVKGLKKLAWGLGVVGGLLGVQSHQYREVTGY